MAIILMLGLPRSGKSLMAVQKWIIPALISKRPVFHNIEGLDERKFLISSYFPDVDPFIVSDLLIKIPSDRVKRFWEFVIQHSATKATNALIVIDEIQNLYPSTDYRSPDAQDFLTYLTTHGHLGHDCLLCTQQEDNVYAGIRRLVEVSYLHTNNKNFGSSGSCRIETFIRDRIGPKLAVHTGITKYDKRVFLLYKSYQSDLVNEKKIVVRWWTDPKLVLVCSVVFISVLFALKGQLTGQGFLHTGAKSFGEEIKEDSLENENSESLNQKNQSVKNEVSECSTGQRIQGQIVESFVNGRWVPGLFASCL